MSFSPHCAHLRAATKMGSATLADTMLTDGLMDAFNGYHMGITAENVARAFDISREQQDDFALASQRKAAAAQDAGHFERGIIPFRIEGGKGMTVVDRDEHIRHDASVERIAGNYH